MALPNNQNASAQPGQNPADKGGNQGQQDPNSTAEARMRRIAQYAGIADPGPVTPHQGKSLPGVQFDKPQGAAQTPSGVTGQSQQGANPAGSQPGQDNAAQELEALKAKVAKFGDPEQLVSQLNEAKIQLQDVGPIIKALQDDPGFYQHMIGYVQQGGNGKRKSGDVAQGQNQSNSAGDGDIRNVLFQAASDLGDVDLDDEIRVADLFNPNSKIGLAFAKMLGNVATTAAGKTVEDRVKQLEGGLTSKLDEVTMAVNSIANQNAITALAQKTGLSPDEVTKALSHKPTALDLVKLHQLEAGQFNQAAQNQQQRQQQPGPDRILNPSADNLNMNTVPNIKHPGEELIEAVEAIAEATAGGIKFDPK